MTKSFEERFDERFPIPKIVKITKSEDTEGVITDYELKDFIRTELQKAREEEWKRCVDLLDHDHSKCIIRETCIGYIAAQSDLMDNPPEGYKEINQEDK